MLVTIWVYACNYVVYACNYVGVCL